MALYTTQAGGSTLNDALASAAAETLGPLLQKALGKHNAAANVPGAPAQVGGPTGTFPTPPGLAAARQNARRVAREARQQAQREHTARVRAARQSGLRGPQLREVRQQSRAVLREQRGAAQSALAGTLLQLDAGYTGPVAGAPAAPVAPVSGAPPTQTVSVELPTPPGLPVFDPAPTGAPLMFDSFMPTGGGTGGFGGGGLGELLGEIPYIGGVLEPLGDIFEAVAPVAAPFIAANNLPAPGGAMGVSPGAVIAAGGAVARGAGSALSQLCARYPLVCEVGAGAVGGMVGDILMGDSPMPSAAMPSMPASPAAPGGRASSTDMCRGLKETQKSLQMQRDAGVEAVRAQFRGPLEQIADALRSVGCYRKPRKRRSSCSPCAPRRRPRRRAKPCPPKRRRRTARKTTRRGRKCLTAAQRRFAAMARRCGGKIPRGSRLK